MTQSDPRGARHYRPYVQPERRYSPALRARDAAYRAALGLGDGEIPPILGNAVGHGVSVVTGSTFW